MALKIGAALMCLLAAFSIAVEAGKKKDAPQSYALVAGTVFQESGFALPNATVTLSPDNESGSAGSKIKKLQAISDACGEFVFRVPAGEMQYTIKVAAKGYLGQQKTVATQGEERTEVTFQLQTESK